MAEPVAGTAPGNGAVRIAAPAKINLYLHVTGRRDDGFHELDSLVVFAGVHDTVELTPADDIELAVVGPHARSLPGGTENLAYAAAERLIAAAGGAGGVHIRLEKRLPVAAGIGGGSADAAAVLRGVAALLEIDTGAVDLDALARALGADVPVCLRGQAVFVGGIGEQLARAPALVPAWLVLANPGVALKTPDVFAGRQGGFSRPGRFDESPGNAKALAELLAPLRNDLTDAAIALQPSVADVLAALRGADECLLARMSGSGATCFGLFADAGAAARAAALLGRDHPGWWVLAAPLLTDTASLGA